MALDALIIGGGIAGLWILRALLNAGYDAALLEHSALGSGQTIASQGIIHAGVKYALSGHAAEASRLTARAAGIWRNALTPPPGGPAPIDLSRARVLSPVTHIFTAPGVTSRLAALAASKALATPPRPLNRASRPPGLADAPASVDAYELDEPVVDVASVLDALAAPVRTRLVLARHIHPARAADTFTIRAETDLAPLDLAPRALILAAGAGNQALLDRLGAGSSLREQRRPLHMVLARGELPELWAHCVALADAPLLTITSARTRSGARLWSIGGRLAELGATRARDEQLDQARRELRECLPWIDLARAQLATFRIDRAEGLDSRGQRPDTPQVRREGRLIACWPTKLVLAPLAADAVLAALAGAGVEPSHASRGEVDAPRPGVALPPWESEDLRWS